MPNYDCIIPWSGGVESTAVVNWAVNNKKNPLCVHTRLMPAEWESVQIMSKIFNVDVFKYQQVNNIPVDSETRDFYSKKLNFDDPTWTPIIHEWVYASTHANLRWPEINNIFCLGIVFLISFAIVGPSISGIITSDIIRS